MSPNIVWSSKDALSSLKHHCWQYTPWVKKQDTLLMLILLDFRNSFTARLCTKSPTKWSLQIATHLTDIAALPCETITFQLLASSEANTLLKRNFDFENRLIFHEVIDKSTVSCFFDSHCSHLNIFTSSMFINFRSTSHVLLVCTKLTWTILWLGRLSHMTKLTQWPCCSKTGDGKLTYVINNSTTDFNNLTKHMLSHDR